MYVCLCVSVIFRGLGWVSVEMVDYGPKWSIMVRNGRLWSEKVDYGRLLSEMIYYDLLWHETGYYGPKRDIMVAMPASTFHRPAPNARRS